MNILIVGNGGREHAIAHKLLQNPSVEKISFSTHNGSVGTDARLANANLPNNNTESITGYVHEERPDLVVVGPEQPLCDGLVDELEALGIPAFGPGAKQAQLEGSKAFAKKFMSRHGIPSAGYEEHTSYEEALDCCTRFGYPVVVKADGLCAGKGVTICTDASEAEQALREIFIEERFGSDGLKVVIEQFLQGFEVSLLCFVSGTKLYPMETAMDYKRIYEGNLGPNTGGVGCISPSPYWNRELDLKSNAILRRIEAGLEADGLGYSGILFIGYMVQEGEPYVLEFNTRFGDPETQVLLPRLQTDLLEHIGQAMRREEVQMAFTPEVCLGTVLVSEGYPIGFDTGHAISGLDAESADVQIYYNGTKRVDDQVLTAGGRVLTVVASAESLGAARERVYAHIELLDYANMRYRKDIGQL